MFLGLFIFLCLPSAAFAVNADEAIIAGIDAQQFDKVPNLIGGWTVNVQKVSEEGFKTERGSLSITEQRGNFFKGHAVPEDARRTNFYGVVVGRDIYITFWDSICSGTLNKKGTQFTFIGQNQQYDPPHSPSTETGVAVKWDSNR